jgi:hypothetical protein
MGDFVKFDGEKPLENRPSRLAPPSPIPPVTLVTTQGLSWVRHNDGFKLIVPDRRQFLSVEHNVVFFGQLIGVIHGPLANVALQRASRPKLAMAVKDSSATL